MRATYALALAFSLSVASAAGAGTPDACIGVLRSSAYDEAIIKNNNSVQDAMHHAFCNTDIGSRGDADKSGFHFGLAYYLKLGIDQTEDRTTIENWKRQYCSADERNFSTQAEAEQLKRVVSDRTVKNYETCIHSQGLFCSITSPSPHLILLQVDWNPYPGTKTLATVTNSQVLNAISSDPDAAPGQVFGSNRDIKIGGRTIAMTRDDVKASVIATVNTDYGTCPEPLVVAEEPALAAKVTISGSVEKSSDISADFPVSLVNAVNVNKWSPCSDSTQSQKFCLPGDDAVVTGDDVFTSNESATCSIATHAKPQMKDGCATVEFKVPGCPSKMSSIGPIKPHVRLALADNAFQKLAFERKHAPYCDQANNYKVTVTLRGRSWSKTSLKEYKADQSTGGSTIVVTYDKSLIDQSGMYRNFDYKYNAIVTFPGSDGRTKIVQLTSENPIQSLGDVTIRSALTPTDGTVVITLDGQKP
jgi:hypothetical protein